MKKTAKIVGWTVALLLGYWLLYIGILPFTNSPPSGNIWLNPWAYLCGILLVLVAVVVKMLLAISGHLKRINR